MAENVRERANLGRINPDRSTGMRVDMTLAGHFMKSQYFTNTLGRLGIRIESAPVHRGRAG